MQFQIAGCHGPLHATLTAALAGQAIPMPTLVNADLQLDAARVIARSTEFALGVRAGLVITLLRPAPPGLAAWHVHEANAALWAFTRQAALEWAARGIRVNAIGLGEGAEDDDVARTVLAIRAWASMTGQIVRLGGGRDIL
jgi:NAD(P)-dependent dehydrogenase (short-subunit alcohol dehydrogenase family)